MVWDTFDILCLFHLLHIDVVGVVKNPSCIIFLNLLFFCSLLLWSIISTYSVIKRGDDLSVRLKRQPRRLDSYVYMPYSYMENLCFKVWISLLRKDTYIKKICVFRSHGSMLASLWILKNICMLCLHNIDIKANTFLTCSSPLLGFRLSFLGPWKLLW